MGSSLYPYYQFEINANSEISFRRRGIILSYSECERALLDLQARHETATITRLLKSLRDARSVALMHRYVVRANISPYLTSLSKPVYAQALLRILYYAILTEYTLTGTVPADCHGVWMAINSLTDKVNIARRQTRLYNQTYPLMFE